MKKIVFIAVCVMLVLSFVGCGSSDELKVDDFDIYEDGKLVMKSNDLEHSEFFSSLQKYDFEGRTLETKKGIKIGSSAREVAAAYKGIISPMLGTGLTLEEYLDSGEVDEEYLVVYGLDDGGKRYILNIDINGNVVEDVSILAGEIS